jgi:hypothetical protein
MLITIIYHSKLTGTPTVQNESIVHREAILHLFDMMIISSLYILYIYN